MSTRSRAAGEHLAAVAGGFEPILAALALFFRQNLAGFRKSLPALLARDLAGFNVIPNPARLLSALGVEGVPLLDYHLGAVYQRQRQKEEAMRRYIQTGGRAPMIEQSFMAPLLKNWAMFCKEHATGEGEKWERVLAGLEKDLQEMLADGLRKRGVPEFLGAWKGIAWHNAKHVFGAASPTITPTTGEIVKNARLAQKVVVIPYRADPPGSGHITDFVMMPVVGGDCLRGAEALSTSLAVTTLYLLGLCGGEAVVESCRAMARRCPAMIARLARGSDRGNGKSAELASLRALREGIITAGWSYAQLTAVAAPGRCPKALVRRLHENGILVELSHSAPPSVIGPLGLAGAYLPDLLQWDGDKPLLAANYLAMFAAARSEIRGSRSGLRAAGYGCPLSQTADGGSGMPGVALTSQLFVELFEVIYDHVAAVV